MSTDVGFTAPKFAMLGVTSAIALVHSAKLCDDAGSCEKENGWAVACSAVSLAICLAYLVVFMFVKGKKDFIPAGLVMQIFCGVMATWWACGAYVMTFTAPFTAPGNGYFGTWLSFFICALACYSSFPSLAEGKDALTQAGNAQCAVLVAGLILLVQAARDCDKAGSCKEEAGWAVACGVLTFVIALALVVGRTKLPAIVNTICIVLQFLMWAAGWVVLTFRRPYTTTGNGYFALLIGFVFSMMVIGDAFGLSAPVERALEDVAEEAKPAEANVREVAADAEQPGQTKPF